MQNNDNQTNQKDPTNGGQNGFEDILPDLCSIWLGRRDSTFCYTKPLRGKGGQLPLAVVVRITESQVFGFLTPPEPSKKTGI